MEKVIVVEDRLDEQCVRHVHLMSNTMIADEALWVYGVEFKNWKVALEAGTWNYRAIYPFRGVIDIPAACKDGKVRRLVIWSLDGYATMKLAFFEAAREFGRLFGGRAVYGFVRKLPKGAEHCQDLGDLTLLEADWMLEKCVAVGCKHDE